MKKKEQPPITLADAERQLRQAQHRLQREENKKAYQRSKKEKERAHRLITRGAEIEHFFPEIKCLTEREFYDLAEMLHDIPAVKALFQDRALRNCIRWSELSKPNTTKLCIASYKPNSCCVIVHTGGTTGFPKGVMLSNENLNASVIQCDLSGFDIQRNHRWLGVMPPFIAYGIGNGLHLPLCKGMTLIVLPKFDPNKYDELLIKYEPNHIAGVPSHYSTIVQSKKIANKDLSFLYSPVVGGDGTEVGFEKTVNSFLLSHHCKTALIKGYGMTEICAAVTATAKQEYNKLGSVGIPFTHSVVGIFRPDSDEELGYNAVGEICMKGPHIMLGYYQEPPSIIKNV